MAQAELIRAKAAFIWQSLWGGLLAALHLAVTDASLCGSPQGRGFTAFPGVSEGLEVATRKAEGHQLGDRALGTE